MPPLLQRAVNIIAVTLMVWTLWDTAIFYLASPSSLLPVAQITAAILVGLCVLAIIVPKKRRGAALRGFHFALIIFFGAMFVVIVSLCAWIYLRAGFSWEMLAFPTVMAGMCFVLYRDWRA